MQKWTVTSALAYTPKACDLQDNNIQPFNERAASLGKVQFYKRIIVSMRDKKRYVIGHLHH